MPTLNCMSMCVKFFILLTNSSNNYQLGILADQIGLPLLAKLQKQLTFIPFTNLGRDKYT